MVESVKQKKICSTNDLIIYIIDAGVGDCILIHQIEKNVKILIDSGPEKGKGRLSVEKALKEILGINKSIELAIVTHNDDDHIGGFCNLIKNNIIEVKEFIFNDASTICKVLPDTNQKYSLKQDKILQETIELNQIKVKTFFNKADSISLEQYSFGDFNLEFLSPNEEKLKKYRSWIASKEKRMCQKPKLSKSDGLYVPTNEDLIRLIEEIKIKDEFIEDQREPNGSSLAFRLEIGNKNFLFLGDSHPTLISEELRRVANNKFDFCKLSHHGSEKNTNKEMLSGIDCKNFIICSDGANGHGHPSLRTLARVLISKLDAKFYFSSDSNEIKNIASLGLLESKLASDGILRIKYEY